MQSAVKLASSCLFGSFSCKSMETTQTAWLALSITKLSCTKLLKERCIGHRRGCVFSSQVQALNNSCVIGKHFGVPGIQVTEYIKAYV
jgi:hypothetical protein